MITLSFEEMATVVDGTLVALDGKAKTNAFATIDSRAASRECFFVALKGEKLDGNDFASSAIESGAQFVLTNVNLGLPSIVVDDPLIALKKLAAYVRSKMEWCAFIAITGSHGKTTTKDLVAKVLVDFATVEECVVAEGSFNNDLGVPLTILRTGEKTKFCVLEMGARHIGDIKELMKIANPDLGVLLVVGSAHVGEFGSRENIALAKSEIVTYLRAGSTAILGNYDPFTPILNPPDGVKKIIFGQDAHCDVRAADIEFRGGFAHFDLVTSDGRAPVELRILGLHQVANALAAAAIAHGVGINVENIAASLSTVESLSKWRMELREIGGLNFVNDSYNANPESMEAALRTVILLSQETGGASWAFLGKMHELGELEEQAHLNIGRLASELGIDHLVAVGTDLYFKGLEISQRAEMTTHFALTQEDALKIFSHVSEGDAILVKASRAEHLDELAEKFIAKWEGVRE